MKYIHYIIATLLLFGFVCFQGIQIKDLQDQVARTQKQLHETEARCQRMTDAAISAMATHAWD